MLLVLTNDDGIDAPGIQALVQAVQPFSDQVVIIAPQAHLSGCSHQVTTTEAIHVEARSNTEFAIAGTPADCVRLAISHLYPEVQWVLSGINAGANLGADAYISGTVAAVREATLHGIRGIAISQYRQGKRAIDWEVAAQLTTQVLAKLFDRPPESGTFWNVNLPHLLPEASLPEPVFCSACIQPLPIDYRIEGDRFYYAGNYAQRPRDPGTDVEVCFSGQIAITQLRL